MQAHMKRGTFRLCILFSVLWVLGMGWYQYQGNQPSKEDGITLSMGNDKELRIDASGIREHDKSAVQMKKLAIILLPALLLLLVVPVGDWLTRGFKLEEK